MHIKTKSIQAPFSSSDGIRICIMRRIKPEFVFDIWMPTLAPSTELLKDYHDQKITWEEYEVRYTSEVLDTERKYLDIVLDITKKQTVTLLCWEETPHMCHRRLVAERLQEMDPQLPVTIS